MPERRSPDPVISAERAMWRDLALLAGLPLLAMIGLILWLHPWIPSWHPPSGTSVYEVAAGQWDWASKPDFCVGDPETISFDKDTTVMIIGYTKPFTDSAGVVHHESVYDIQWHDDHRIRGLIRGETRLTADGKPVVWDLILTSPHSYVWHRTDWTSAGHTGELRRCPAGPSIHAVGAPGDTV